MTNKNLIRAPLLAHFILFSVTLWVALPLLAIEIVSVIWAVQYLDREMEIMSSVLLKTADSDLTKMSKSVMH